MIVRATSDLHLTPRTAPWVFAARSERRADAEAHGGITVLAGDIFHQAETVHMPTYNRLREMLQGWPAEIYAMAGNHDQYDGSRNCLEALDGGSCTVVSEPMWSPVGRMIPYTKPEDFTAALDSLVPQIHGMPKLVWTHHGYKGAYVNAMHRNTEGVSYGAIPDGHIVISGHYHMPQNLARIIYCGSPYETTFAEEGQLKGWLRWDDALTNPIPVRIPFGDLGAPRHHTVHWDPKEGPPVRPAGMKDGDLPRIVALATREEVKAHAKQLEGTGLEGVPVIAQPTKGTTRGVIDARMGPREAAHRYMLSECEDPTRKLDFAEEVDLWR